MQGVLAMTMVVRDEEEILAANLAYHRALGVDVILVIDHGSSDATPEILDRHAGTGAVRWWRRRSARTCSPTGSAGCWRSPVMSMTPRG